MMFVENWGEVWTSVLIGVAQGLMHYLPVFILAAVIFVIGWVVAVIVEKIIETVFKSLKIDNLLRAAGVEETVKRAGYNLNSGLFIGALVKWFLIIVFLVASFDVLGLTQVNEFLRTVVLSYLPNVISAVLILMVSIVIAETVRKFVTASAKAAHLSSANLLGSVTKWAIWIFAILTVLFQLGIAAPLIMTLYTGIVVAISLAAGLAFGLGGKEAAADFISKIKQDIAHHQ